MRFSSFPAILLFLAPLFGQLSPERWQEAASSLVTAIENGELGGMGEHLSAVLADNSKRAVKLIARAFPHVADDFAAYEAFRDGVAALSEKAALREARKLAVRGRDFRTRIAIIEGLALRNQDEDWEVCAKALNDKDPTVQITAARLLGASHRRESVQPLIALMESLDREECSVWESCGAALYRLLGKELPFGADYRSWWKMNGDDFTLPSEVSWSNPEPDDDEGTVTFFGQRLRCKKVVFIIDISGSMESTDPYPPGFERSVERNPTGGPDPKRKRIYRAKKELVKVLSQLEKDVQFNILAYSSRVVPWVFGEGSIVLHQATAANVKKATEWVEGLKAEGVTVTDDALAMGLDIKEARCLYLLSDGFATADGRNKIPTENILALVREKNRYKKATIFTFGFQGADEELMVALARETGGKYRSIEW